MHHRVVLSSWASSATDSSPKFAGILEEGFPISLGVLYKSMEIEVFLLSMSTSAGSMVYPHHEVAIDRLDLGHNVLEVLANVATLSPEQQMYARNQASKYTLWDGRD